MVDPRGTRFAALLTSAVLVAMPLAGDVWLLAVDAAVFFLVGTVTGVRHAPYSLIFSYPFRLQVGPPAAFSAPVPPPLVAAPAAHVAADFFSVARYISPYVRQQ